MFVNMQLVACVFAELLHVEIRHIIEIIEKHFSVHIQLHTKHLNCLVSFLCIAFCCFAFRYMGWAFSPSVTRRIAVNECVIISTMWLHTYSHESSSHCSLVENQVFTLDTHETLDIVKLMHKVSGLEEEVGALVQCQSLEPGRRAGVLKRQFINHQIIISPSSHFKTVWLP